MPAVKLKTFGGIIPKIDPRLLPADAAQTAENVIIESGTLAPLKAATTVVGSTAGHKMAHYWRNRQKTPVAETWRTWAEAVNVIGSPVADDAYSRYFYSGASDGKLKVYGSFGTDSAGEERDVAMPIPVITGVGFAAGFRADPSTWLCRRYINGTDTPDWAGGKVCAYVSHEFTESGLKVKFRVPSFDTNNASTFFVEPHVFLRIGTDQLPATWGETAKTTYMFSCGESLELSDTDGKYGDLVPVGWSYDNPVAMTPTKTYTFPGFDLIIEFKPNYLQAFDLYYHYLLTYVDDTGVEGPPSDLSEFITRRPGQAVTLSSLPTGGGVATVEKKRIYRSAAGSVSDDFLFLTELDKATTSFVDALEDAAMAEPLGVYGNPPDDMGGLVALACGSAAAFKGKDVYLTRPYHLHVWPSSYNFVAASDVVALAALGNDLHVLTKGFPEVISGTHPEFMSVQKIEEPQACASARSVAIVSGQVLYASPDGLVSLGRSGARLLTGRHYSREQWQALGPTTMVGVAHDQKYYGFTATGGIIVDFSDGTPRITTHDEVVSGAVGDLETDLLYIIQGGNLRSWNTAAAKTMTWKGRKIQLDRNMTWSCARIIGDDFDIDDIDTEATLKIYGAGELLATVYTRTDLAFRLPAMRPEKVWEFEIEASVHIRELQVATGMEALQ